MPDTEDNPGIATADVCIVTKCNSVEPVKLRSDPAMIQTSGPPRVFAKRLHIIRDSHVLNVAPPFKRFRHGRTTTIAPKNIDCCPKASINKNSKLCIFKVSKNSNNEL
jgi:hypothetical protein